jgi:pimeloyl-ACP methyl ester carboxylesterase
MKMLSVRFATGHSTESDRQGNVGCAMTGVQTKMVQLQDGGRIAIDEYGDPAGQPVFFCHGWPSSRMMAVLTEEAARDLGVRIISPDRPGVNESAYQKERTLLDWPVLLRQLAAQLGIEKFRVLGISGGAPYAFASAWSMPGQVEAIAIVSGVPPIAELSGQDGLLKLYRWMLALYRDRPRLLRTCFHVARPFARVRMPIRFRPMLLKLLQPCDAEVLRDSRAFEACFESQRQAWRISAEGVMVDAEIYARPWGFALEEVRVPVRLWHGTADRSFSYRLAEQVAQRLPNCQARFVEAAGHYSLPIRHMHEILADLIAM